MRSTVAATLRRRSLAALALPALFAAAAPARAVERPIDSARLWATVNVCDTAARPSTIGLRASMPGTGSGADAMFMRFQVQYFSVKDGAWHRIGYSGDSGFVGVGSGRQKQREAGRSFVLAPLVGGAAYQLRGLVTFEWRRDGVPIHRLRRVTTPKHTSAAGADPPGYSAAICAIG